jgi:hypothetical protein
LRCVSPLFEGLAGLLLFILSLPERRYRPDVLCLNLAASGVGGTTRPKTLPSIDERCAEVLADAGIDEAHRA